MSVKSLLKKISFLKEQSSFFETSINSPCGPGAVQQPLPQLRALITERHNLWDDLLQVMENHVVIAESILV